MTRPLSLPCDYAEVGEALKGSLRRAKKRRALDNFARFREDSLR